MYKAIVFDFDGVITDGIPFHDKAYLKIFQKNEIDISLKKLHKKIGLTISQVISQVFDEYSKKTDINSLVEKHGQILYELYLKNSIIPEYLIDFIKSCKKNDLGIAVASSTNSKIIQMVLKKFNIANYFNVVIGGENIEKGKPNPEMIEKALKKLEIDSKYAIAIDDVRAGILAAKSISMYAIAYLKYSEKNISEANINVRNFNEIGIDKIVMDL